MMRLQQELTLGAQLADLSLTPGLPDLADLPAMSSEPITAGDSVDGSYSATQHHSTHNCCSTCCDDHDNDSDEESISEKAIVSCRCGFCPECDAKHNIEKTMDKFQRLTFISEGTQVHRNHLQTAHVLPANRYSEEEFSKFDNNEDYVEFYKRNLHFQMDQIDQGIGEEPYSHNPVHCAAQCESEIINKNTRGCVIKTVNIHDMSARGSASDNENEHLDYSVESAQGVLSENYSSRFHLNYEGYISNSLGSESDSGRYSMSHPTAVTMATVTTSTPVAIASSRMGLSTSRSNSIRSTVSNNNESSLHQVSVSDVQTAISSEAPAKLITSRHRITVLKAHTQETYSPIASFQAIPLTKGRGHTLPQIPPKPKPDGIQSLQRSAGLFAHPRQYACYPTCIPENNVPTNVKMERNIPRIRTNNYLDFSATSFNKQTNKMHPRQPVHVTPRSLYLRHQKKELHQQQLREKKERQLIEKKLNNDTVYQPDAYAQGVGVPLQPTPTIAGYSHCINHQSLGQGQNISNTPTQLHSSSKYICQPFVKNFFQNPPPPSLNIAYDPETCMHGNGCSFSHEPKSPTSRTYHQYNPQPLNYPAVHHEPQHFASVYTNQVSLSQIEQYKAQLNSDVDYVIYPLKDPAISRQEYMDAKQSQIIANQTQHQLQLQLHGQQQNAMPYNINSQGSYRPPIPPYRSPKLSPLYRSTPNVAGQMGGSVLSSYPSYQSLASHNSMHQPGSSSGYSSMARGRYYSQQSLASSLSSTQSGYSASTHSLSGSMDPYVDMVMATAPPAVTRVRSDESILSSAVDESETLSMASGPPQIRPPPPYRPKVTMQNKYVQ